MDPNMALRELRLELSAEDPDIERVRDLVAALDSWLTRGGFLPSEWERHGIVEA